MGRNEAKDGCTVKQVIPIRTSVSDVVPAGSPVLSSWKEIGAYLGRSVRTVQRMEVELGLPVRRPRGHARSSVMAIPHELDTWLKSFAPHRTTEFSPAAASSPRQANGKTRVLVVDDKDVTLYLMSKQLSSRGYEVSMAQSARSGLKMAFFADLVLLDVNLPEIHGFEVLRRLQSSLTTSHIPVICTSATYSPEGAAPLALQLGAKRFLNHPISADALHCAIQEALEKKAGKPFDAAPLSLE